MLESGSKQNGTETDVYLLTISNIIPEQMQVPEMQTSKTNIKAALAGTLAGGKIDKHIFFYFSWPLMSFSHRH